MIYDPASGLHLPVPDRDRDQRLQLLDNLGLAEPEQQFDAFAEDLAAAFQTPYGFVNVFTDEQRFVGLHNPPGDDLPTVDRTMPVDHGYCPEVVATRKTLALPDVYAHPRFASNPVVDRIGIRLYVGAPLIHQPTGIVLGTVCVVGPTQRPRSTAPHSQHLINQHRDAFMKAVYQRTGNTPQ